MKNSLRASPLRFGHASQFSNSARTRGSPRGAPNDGLTAVSMKRCGGEFHEPRAAGFLGLKMGEEPALGEPEIVGESPDGEALEPELGGQARGVLQDRLPGDSPPCSWAHNSTNVRFARLRLSGPVEGA